MASSITAIFSSDGAASNIACMSYPVVAVRQPNRTVVYLSVRGPIEVGRECDGLLLGDLQVSRRHLMLDVADDQAVVTDLGSTNGTTLDEQLIDAPVVLLTGSIIGLGHTTIELVDSSTLVAAAGSDNARVTVVTDDERPLASFDPRLSSIDLVASQVAAAGLDVRRLRTDQGTVTIVFSDIESSTERNMEMGDQEWFQVLSEHNAIIRRQLAEFNGAEVKNQGDGFMLSFPGARLALQCMMEVQRDMTERAEADPARAISIRVGLHTGEVLVDDDGDLFGKHVVVAARVADLARGGEILVSSLVREITSARGDVVFGDEREVELKGIEGVHVVSPVDWSEPLND